MLANGYLWPRSLLMAIMKSINLVSMHSKKEHGTCRNCEEVTSAIKNAFFYQNMLLLNCLYIVLSFVIVYVFNNLKFNKNNNN